MIRGGICTVSLDFELHWGGFEKWPLNDHYRAYFKNTRESIPKLLSLFAQSRLHVTWAAVGLLMHTKREELMAHLPELKPTYNISDLSAYDFMEKESIGDGESDDPYHYAGSIIDQIKKVPGQEVGTHTFSHYYCNESGQTVQQFRDDIRAAKKSAHKYNLGLKSLVFPRNQF